MLILLFGMIVSSEPNRIYICSIAMFKGLSVLFALISGVYFVTVSLAQECNPAGSGLGIEANLISGKIIRHEKKFTAPIPALSNALDVNFSSKTFGKKEWHQRRNFPVWGVGITYTGYGNNAVFGHCISIYPDLQIPILRWKNLEWTFRFGDGVAYVTKKYQRIYPIDTLNTAIGTHFNDFAILMTDLKIHMDEHWHLQFGANFTHISNGDLHQPNLGVNMGGIHAGVQYFPVTCRPKPMLRDLPKLKKRWLVEARIGVAFNEARAKDSLTVPSYITTFYVSRRWQSMNKFFCGFDYAYHSDVYAFLKNYGVEYGHEMGHSWDGAIFAGNECLVGRFGLVAQLGCYYHQTWLKFDPFYEKLGTNIYLIRQERGPLKELFVSAFLLTHEIVAQYGEFGMGVGF